MQCFVVSEIGAEGSPTRIRADQVFRHILRPALRSRYALVRADQIASPGLISRQIIDQLFDADLVVADLTGHNANVFYELAIRHTVGKPCIQVAARNERLPFDVADTRTIFFDINDLDSVDSCKREVSAQASIVRDPDYVFVSPVSRAVDLGELKRSRNPIEQGAAEIVALLQEIRRDIGTNDGYASPSADSSPAADFLALRRALRDLVRAGSIPRDAVTLLADTLATDAPILARWLSSLIAP